MGLVLLGLSPLLSSFLWVVSGLGLVSVSVVSGERGTLRTDIFSLTILTLVAGIGNGYYILKFLFGLIHRGCLRFSLFPFSCPPDVGYTLHKSVSRYRLESVLYTHVSRDDVYTGRRKFSVPCRADVSFNVSVLKCKLITYDLAEAPTRHDYEFEWKSANVSSVFVQENADSIVPEVKLSDTCQVDFMNQVSGSLLRPAGLQVVAV